MSAALDGGGGQVEAVILRETFADDRHLVSVARALVPRCRALGAKLLLHRRADLVTTVGAAGVHLTSASPAAREVRGLLGSQAL
ncbi:MAG: thiamine phosphate synthase, partial [Bdellovibrionales bacterium]|nr:thiamine phosphate synthase [Bdellovibrionales bacterium]